MRSKSRNSVCGITSVIFHTVTEFEVCSWCTKNSQMTRLPSACWTVLRTSPVSESARRVCEPRKCVSVSTNSTVMA